MAIDIGSRLEPFWDDFLIDTERTTAQLRVHRPVPRGVVMTCGEGWEGDGCDYFNIVDDGALYRMYYLAWEMLSPDGTAYTERSIKVCCALSRDGLTWEKPRLGLCEFGGSKENNIILDESTHNYDNFMVMLDKNPRPAVPGRFKAVARHMDGGAPVLAAYVSDDGVRFSHSHTVTDRGVFDSLNSVHWSEEHGGYVCFVRGFHGGKSGPFSGVRDIRVLFSKDFINWSAPERLDFLGGEDVALYTNCAFAYPRAPHIFVGMPSRYVERREWTANFDRLCGAQKRRARVQISPRYGLATTDCVFMCSRDAKRWARHDEAFITPGPENGRNWVYGDGYPALGLTEIPPQIRGAESVLGLYLNENHWMGEATELRLYELRKDGFASRRAGARTGALRTVPFRFDGGEMRINFATSAAGFVRILLRDTESGKTLQSGELFGDSTERPVDFDLPVAELSGRPVVMEAEMRDADLFAMAFSKQPPGK